MLINYIYDNKQSQKVAYRSIYFDLFCLYTICKQGAVCLNAGTVSEMQREM